MSGPCTEPTFLMIFTAKSSFPERSMGHMNVGILLCYGLRVPRLLEEIVHIYCISIAEELSSASKSTVSD